MPEFVILKFFDDIHLCCGKCADKQHKSVRDILDPFFQRKAIDCWLDRVKLERVLTNKDGSCLAHCAALWMQPADPYGFKRSAFSPDQWAQAMVARWKAGEGTLQKDILEGMDEESSSIITAVAEGTVKLSEVWYSSAADYLTTIIMDHMSVKAGRSVVYRVQREKDNTYIIETPTDLNCDLSTHRNLAFKRLPGGPFVVINWSTGGSEHFDLLVPPVYFMSDWQKDVERVRMPEW